MKKLPRHRPQRRFPNAKRLMDSLSQQKLANTNAEHGGLIWAVDALQPEGHGTLLYVLYEVLSGTVVSGIQLQQASTAALKNWLKPYQEWPFAVLATLSDGEEAIVAALKQCWSQALTNDALHTF